MKDEMLSAGERLIILFQLVKSRYGYPLSLDDIPLDDEATWQLFRSGKTDSILHFRTAGMKAYLEALQPDSLSDLETLLLLYRNPKLCSSIPVFIQNKKAGLPFSVDENDVSQQRMLYIKEQVKAVWKTAYLIAHFCNDDNAVPGTPPDENLLKTRLAELKRLKDDAVKQQLFEQASRLRDEERRLLVLLAELEDI